MSSPVSRRKLDLHVRNIAELRKIAFQIGMLGYDDWPSEESQALRDAILRTEEGQRMFTDSGRQKQRVIVGTPKTHPKIAAAVVASQQKRSRDTRDDANREALIAREELFRNVLQNKVVGWVDHRLRKEAKLGYVDVVNDLIGTHEMVSRHLRKLQKIKASKDRARAKAAKHPGDDKYQEKYAHKKAKYAKAKAALFTKMEEVAARNLLRMEMF